MKYGTFEEYPPNSHALPEKALLTVWDALAANRGDMVLVGGLAVRHLTKPVAQGKPGAVTLDVDFGISIAMDNGMYGSIRDTLSAQSFQWDGKRFVRSFPEMELYVDLLTDDGESEGGAAVLDNGLHVGIIPGVNRALEHYTTKKIEGENLVGAEISQTIKIAEVGPMLVMKLNAFGGSSYCRKAPKDAHECLLLAEEYQGGIAAAVKGFHDERAAQNRGFPYAEKCLKECYRHEEDEGPMACAAFRLNNRHQEGAFEEESLQIRQRCVTLAEALLKT